MHAIRKLTRDAILIALSIGALLLLFSLQVLLSQDFVTGDAIQIGKPENAIVIIPEQPTLQQPEAVNPKLQCWLDRGLRAEDLSIVGPLLQQTTCTTGIASQPLRATVETNCVAVHVGDAAATRLCLKNEVPAFSVDLSPSPTTTPVVVPPPQYNYWLALLLFLIGMCILFVWGRADLAGDYYRRRSSQDFTRLLPGNKEVQIRYIRPPPVYVKHDREPEQKPVVTIKPSSSPTPLVQATSVPLESQKILSSPINKSLIHFNALSQSLCDLIALKKFTAAEQQYPDLYRLALTLYPQVSHENKARLMKVVTSLHEQLQAVRKAYAVVQTVRDVYQHEERQAQLKEPSVLVWKPASLDLKKEQIHHLDAELTKLREKLQQTPKKQPGK